MTKGKNKEFRSLKEIMSDPEVLAIYEAGIYQQKKDVEEMEEKYAEEVNERILNSILTIRISA